jgi:hypothetical protein
MLCRAFVGLKLDNEKKTLRQLDGNRTRINYLEGSYAHHCHLPIVGSQKTVFTRCDIVPPGLGMSRFHQEREHHNIYFEKSQKRWKRPGGQILDHVWPSQPEGQLLGSPTSRGQLFRQIFDLFLANFRQIFDQFLTNFLLIGTNI